MPSFNSAAMLDFEELKYREAVFQISYANFRTISSIPKFPHGKSSVSDCTVRNLCFTYLLMQQFKVGCVT